MKKIFFWVLLINVFGWLNSQPVADTSAYLKDSILQNKNYYIGKPLGVLLKRLKIEIVDNNDLASILGTTDTVFTKETKLTLFPVIQLIDRVNEQRITPAVIITFQDTLAIPRKYFYRGGILDYEEGWNRSKRNYWGQFIVADIRVIGVH